MLHILLLILKLIGIILLVLLGILIVTLCIVLFVPAIYRIEVKNKKIEIKASWLFRLLYAFYVVDGKYKEWQVRIGWKKLNNEGNGETFIDKESEKEENVTRVDIEEAVPEEAFEKNENDSKKKQSKNKKIQKRKKKWFEKIKCTIKKICDRIKQMIEMKDKLVDYLSDEVHVAGFKKAKKEIFVLLRRIRPRKIHGYIRFGTDDPYHTGQILAGLSVLYPFYGDNIEIIPIFEEKVLEGNLYIHGKIHIITLVITLWNLFLDENIRKTWNDLKKLRA